MNIGDLVAVPEWAQRRVLRMQTKLHRWASFPFRRFDDLFNLVADPAFLVVAWMRVSGNTGARSAGVDRLTVRSVVESSAGVVGLLEDIRGDLKARVFRPLPVRERRIPKAGGKVRGLGIPTVRDRVVQASLKLVLEPIFEAGFRSSSYGFRPRRRAQDAIEEIRHFTYKGYEYLFEGDIAACFDEIDHTALIGLVRRKVTDKRVLGLVKAFLRAGILGEDGVNRETYSGTPQGGILSPLLANIALSVLDDHFQQRWDDHRNATARMMYRRRGGATYRLVRYADDFVVMVNGTRTHAEELWSDIAAVLAQVGLRLSPEKTKIATIDEGIDFLGFTIRRFRQYGSQRHYIYSFPSRKSLDSIRRKVKAATKQTVHQHPASLFRQLGTIIRGWAQYFRHSSASKAFHHLQRYLWWRVWEWLKNKHPHTSRRILINRYYNGWWPEYQGVSLWQPTTMTIERYRYRGNQIPTPWTEPTQTA